MINDLQSDEKKPKIEPPKLPVGIEDFEEMRQQPVGLNGGHLVISDKTKFLPDLVPHPLISGVFAVYSRLLKIIRNSRRWPGHQSVNYLLVKNSV